MALIVDAKLLDLFRTINLDYSSKVKFSALIGTVDVDKKEVALLTSVHFPFTNSSSAKKFVITPDEVNQLQALQFMLPYNLGVLGVCFYYEEDISDFTLEDLTKKFKKIPSLQFLIKIGKVENEFYQLIKDKPTKISAKTRDFSLTNLINFIHTVEFEEKEEVVEESSELKKAMFKGIDILWDKIGFSKNQDKSLLDIQASKSPIDRIIEIIIPCEEKDLTSKTEAGMVFLAIDLHMNFFVKDSIRYKKLSDIKEMLNKAMKQDLMIKLQRSVYDAALKRLKLPEKVPIKFYGLEFNGYLSKKSPSKFEFDFCDTLRFHAEIMYSLDFMVPSRILLRDLMEYYKKMEKKEKYLEINNLITKLN